MEVWRSDNGSIHINKVILRRPRLVLRVWDAWPFTGIQPRYVTNHFGWLSLLPSVGREISMVKGQWQCSALGR